MAAEASAGLALRVEPPPKPPAEFNALDYVAFLLTIDAEIENSMTVQYLYAAYSLGGPNWLRQIGAGWPWQENSSSSTFSNAMLRDRTQTFGTRNRFSWP